MARTALVTGASGGIGSATARDLGQDHDVVVHYHSDRVLQNWFSRSAKEAI